jgi:hypothetical protein
MGVVAGLEGFIELLGDMQLNATYRRAYADRITELYPDMAVDQMILVDSILGPPSAGWSFVQKLSRKRPRNDELNERLLKMSRETLLDIVSAVEL